MFRFPLLTTFYISYHKHFELVGFSFVVSSNIRIYVLHTQALKYIKYSKKVRVELPRRRLDRKLAGSPDFVGDKWILALQKSAKFSFPHTDDFLLLIPFIHYKMLKTFQSKMLKMAIMHKNELSTGDFKKSMTMFQELFSHLARYLHLS